MSSNRNHDATFWRSSLGKFIAPMAVTLLFVVSWHMGVRISGVSQVVIPAPLDVANAFVQDLEGLSIAAGHTALAAFTGLFGSITIGMLTAFAFSQSPPIRTALYPYAILLQTVPIIAIAPIVVLTVNRGFTGVAVISMIISIFPIITNTTTGLLQVDKNLLELFELHSASRWQTLMKLRLPNAIPYLISGIRIAGGAAIVGAIVGEFFVGSSMKGLGVLIEQRRHGLNTDELYATVLTSTLLGITFFAIVTVCGDWLLRCMYGKQVAE